MKIIAIPPWNVREIGRQNMELVERSVSRASNMTAEELLRACCRREAVLWVIVEKCVIGVCFTRVVKLADWRRAVEVTALAGALEWTALLRKRLHEYREAERAELLLVVGRRGWGRVFNKAPVGMNSDGCCIFEDYG